MRTPTLLVVTLYAITGCSFSDNVDLPPEVTITENPITAEQQPASIDLITPDQPIDSTALEQQTVTNDLLTPEDPTTPSNDADQPSPNDAITVNNYQQILDATLPLFRVTFYKALADSLANGKLIWGEPTSSRNGMEILFNCPDGGTVSHNETYTSDGNAAFTSYLTLLYTNCIHDGSQFNGDVAIDSSLTVARQGNWTNITHRFSDFEHIIISDETNTTLNGDITQFTGDTGNSNWAHFNASLIDVSILTNNVASSVTNLSYQHLFNNGQDSRITDGLVVDELSESGNATIWSNKYPQLIFTVNTPQPLIYFATLDEQRNETRNESEPTNNIFSGALNLSANDESEINISTNPNNNYETAFHTISSGGFDTTIEDTWWYPAGCPNILNSKADKCNLDNP